jgi:hypothetical protein
MFGLSYCILFFAATNAARLRRHGGNCTAPTPAGAIAQASNTVPVSSLQSLNPAPSSQPQVEYVYITEYTTVYPSTTPEALISTPISNVPGTGGLTTLASKTKACSARFRNSTGMASSSGQYSGASLAGSLVPYGSGLPGLAPSSFPYDAGVPIASLVTTPDAAISSAVAAISLPQYPESPAAPSVGQSTDVPTPSPPPPASSARAMCKRKAPKPSPYNPSSQVTPSPLAPTLSSSSSTPLSVPHFTYDPLPESSPALSTTPTTIMSDASTAAVIVPITPMPNVPLANAPDQPYQVHGQWKWTPWKRADEFCLHETSTTTSTTTIETTVTTRMPVSRTSKLASASADISKTTSIPASETAGVEVILSLLPLDAACYYPLPGLACRPQKTTLITKTRGAKTTDAKTSEAKPEMTQKAWCAYPGQEC